MRQLRHLHFLLVIIWMAAPAFMINVPKAAAAEWTEPIKGEITDQFGTRGGRHRGLDIAAPEGESVMAAADGTVSKSYRSDSYGEVIFIKHDNGYETVYAHLSKRLKKENDRVKKGEEIGVIGNTGISTGTHLHFEMHEGSWTKNKRNAINPLTVFSEQAFQQNSVHVHKGEAETGRAVTVKQGDTLWKISKESGVSVKRIMDLNGLADSHLYIGQTLRLHDGQAKRGTYIVQKGDTLYQIAEKMGVTVQHIQAWNGLKGEQIYPQQSLKIRETPERST
ncbi:peptidoglycan DD-metalloendopeptidase family protein [Bacillus swezeyi]|uniref:Peptigoglycan-binding protein LysM n=1 Tax=Bacillus swezeyi TaxID=1925020 RepID=A0A1R1QGB9_9BACI|nr:M23 family metallopeptidase [Bacillus swezeyi]MEC1260492.1 peptidoglycan DD-metalloendopeptidase family protein [Bacillus swezeyi]MED2929595.1 peptidoglycan DD-metalloendopeptidase family protein [Bacillus swezeyi]MED2943656.1 peptidoglycan DD-metalloendopeptidase family protein [Bacillus swezeyi]MED2963378.1 peptidoglycan DD-metalloendopeptidase family protein [Bacillus swezeyi]MED3073329.1 peptidoglycan DD-metalloendopeptidase family protein [Bacillus swezeyi]